MAVHRVVEYVRPADSRLGRNVNHDPRSKAYPVKLPRRVPLQTVRHVRHVPIFDQGDLGSCTGNAALGCLGTGVFFATMDVAETEQWPWDQTGAVGVYAEATGIDPFDGTYPPTDTGSDGLSVAKVLKRAGLIAGYEHAFSLDQTLQALMSRPFITGTLWMSGMFDPDPEGIVHPTGRGEGGHEYVGVGYDHERGLIWFANSWGERWGSDGYFAMPVEEYGTLLDRMGDVTFFVPSDAEPPEPVPTEDPATADADLAAAVGAWARRDALCGRTKRRAIVKWMEAKGL